MPSCNVFCNVTRVVSALRRIARMTAVVEYCVVGTHHDIRGQSSVNRTHEWIARDEQHILPRVLNTQQSIAFYKSNTQWNSFIGVRRIPMHCFFFQQTCLCDLSKAISHRRLSRGSVSLAQDSVNEVKSAVHPAGYLHTRINIDRSSVIFCTYHIFYVRPVATSFGFIH